MPADSSLFRCGNRALDYLLAQDLTHESGVLSHIDFLPRLADELYDDAQVAARNLLRMRTSNPITKLVRSAQTLLTGSPPKKQTALAKSFFDLILVVYFSEVSKIVPDKRFASCLVDALLYQATGDEASSPTDGDVLFFGSHNARGLHKFQIARRLMPHISAIEAWIFGKEAGAIISNNPLGIAGIVSVAPFFLVAFHKAKNRINYVLYGTLPTEDDMQELNIALDRFKAEIDTAGAGSGE